MVLVISFILAFDNFLIIFERIVEQLYSINIAVEHISLNYISLVEIGFDPEKKAKLKFSSMIKMVILNISRI